MCIFNVSFRTVRERTLEPVVLLSFTSIQLIGLDQRNLFLYREVVGVRKGRGWVELEASGKKCQK